MGLFYIIVLLLAVPVGFLLAWLARDELVQGRRYFMILSYLCAFGSLFYFMMFGASGQGISTGFSILFVGIISYIAYMKSFDKTFTKTKRNL